MSDESMTVEFRAGEGVRLEPAEWEARAAAMFRSLAEDPDVPREDAREALLELRLNDRQRTTWVFDGAAWLSWDGQQWQPGRPTGPLWLQPFTMTTPPPAPEAPPLGVPPLEDTEDEYLPADPHGMPPDDLDDESPARTGFAPPEVAPPVARAGPEPGATRVPPVYRPTHTVPAGGLAVWSAPDPSAAPAATLDDGLDVMLVERRPDGWARVVCSNGWSGWVDGRRLTDAGTDSH